LPFYNCKLHLTTAEIVTSCTLKYALAVGLVREQLTNQTVGLTCKLSPVRMTLMNNGTTLVEISIHTIEKYGLLNCLICIIQLRMLFRAHLDLRPKFDVIADNRNKSI